MTEHTPTKIDKNKDRGPVTDVPNPFFAMRSMMAKSVGKLPATLVVIFAVAVAMASLTAIMMTQIQPAPAQREFMPQRLAAIVGATPIDEKGLRGVWSVEASDFAMTITMVDKKFEWIIRMNKEKNAMFFVRGNYRVDGDVLIFGSRNDMGFPSGEGVKYLPVDIIDINVRASVDKQQMIWHVPVSEQNAYSTRMIHIFDRQNQADFVWKRVQ